MPRHHHSQYALLTFAGLSGIAIEELGVGRGSVKAVKRLRNYDFVLCTLEARDEARLARLRTVEDLFWLMGPPQRVASQRDLSRIDGAVVGQTILKGLEIRNRLFHPKKPKRPTFTCFAKQDRDRRVYRKEIARRIISRVSVAFPKWKNADPAAVELWAFHIDELLYTGFRLSDERMRYRGREPVMREGALRPTIAAAMVRIAAPTARDRLVDPMCGTGTILAEASEDGSGVRCAGGDNDREALEAAKWRLGRHPVRLHQWDATALPFEASSIDCIVCNLPFGKQYSTTADNRELYPALIRNWAQKLKPNGRMVLLTADARALDAALARHRLRGRVQCKVKVLGVWAQIYKVTTKGNTERTAHGR